MSWYYETIFIKKEASFCEMPETSEVDRASLVDLLGVKLKGKAKEAPVSIRVGVDKKLAKLFGAHPFLGRWDILPKRVYSLEGIGGVLRDAGVEIPAEEFVGEKFVVDWYHALDAAAGRTCNEFYFFRKFVDKQGVEEYCLTFHPHVDMDRSPHD